MAHKDAQVSGNSRDSVARDKWGFEAGLIGILFGMVVATVPLPIYLALVLRVDRYEKEPIWILTMGG